ncbi:hypothetical protein F4560_003128 [Saccharothrix ecbatanensis]|uniref:Uncharacterized protein n=1 Tax=Saccharothrix ecbatanensis TaxID=1105145 RepID=A0A7W9HJN2_9PSEU|nr:hypothetical protein [Saccharothrix ecbatanensis]
MAQLPASRSLEHVLAVQHWPHDVVDHLLADPRARPPPE